jgi:Na+/H+ antiporter NhaC
MIKTLGAILLLVSLPLSSAFDYNITATGGLSLYDVKSGIDEVVTLFNNEFVTVTVVDIEWGARVAPSNSSNSITYKTYVDGMLQAEGSVSLADVGRELPTSVEAGDISVSSSGSHTILVVLSVDEDSADTESSYQSFGAGASLIPLIVVLILAMTTHQVELSLGIAIGVGACMITGNIKDGFKSTLDNYVLNALVNVDHAYVYLFTLFLSGMVAMMEKSGGLLGFTKELAHFASSPRSGQFAAFFSGLFIFFDDYASVLLVGESMQPFLDLLHVSRQKLAFIVDATSAPIASLTPVSSWVGFEVGLIQDQIDLIVKREGTDNLSIQTSGMAVFLQSIRYRYYPIFMLLLMPILILLKRDYGPMLIAERKTQVYKRIDGGDGHGRSAGLGTHANAPEEDTPLKSWNMIFPVLLLVFFILWMLTTTGDDDSGTQSFIDKLEGSDSYSSLLWGTMGATLVTYVFYMIQFKRDGALVLPSPSVIMDYFKSLFVGTEKFTELNSKPAVPIMTVYEAMEAFLYGMGRIFPALIVLTLAWAAGSLMTAVGANRLFSSWIVDSGIPAEALPTMSFIISLLMALATGTSWGTMSIMFPLIMVPTWISCKGDATIFYATVAGVLSGSVAGDHLSPISDTTVLSALASDCDLLQHVVTQAPYGGLIALLAILLGTLPVGYGVPNAVCVLLGLVVIVLFVFFICQPVISKTGKFDITTELYMRIKGEDCGLHKLKTDTIAAWEHEYNGGPAVGDAEEEGVVEALVDDEMPHTSPATDDKAVDEAVECPAE